MNKIITISAKIFILFISPFCFSFAQGSLEEGIEEISIENLMEIKLEDLMNIPVITPTQNLQKSKHAPATVLVVTNDQIRLRGYKNLAEVLNDLPDIKVSDKSDPQVYNTVSIRGVFRQDFFVILLDGVKISSPTNEPLPIIENFPIYLAKQIEIVYGPGSALYGADAMAGVINIITDSGSKEDKLILNTVAGTQGYSSHTLLYKKELNNGFSISSGGQYSYDAQPDFSKVYKKEYNMEGQQTGVFNSAFGPITPVQPINPKYEAPLKAYNLYAAAGKGGFVINMLHHYAEISSSTSFKPDNAVYNKSVLFGQGVTTVSTSFTTTGDKVRSSSSVTGSFYQVNPKSNFRNLNGGLDPGYKYSTGSMFKIKEQINFDLSKQINLIGGATFERFQSLPKTPELANPVNRNESISGTLLNSTSLTNPGGIEARLFPLVYTNIGAYFQGQYMPIDRLSFTLGLRYDHNSRFGASFNPRVGAVFTPTEKTTFKALYGTAYWAPSPLISFESYGRFYSLDGGQTFQSDYWHLPNPTLKPMTLQTSELSINQKIGKKFNATLTGYYTKIDNVIANGPDNGNTDLYENKFLGWEVAYIEVPFNHGSQEIIGGNLMMNYGFHIGAVNINAYSSISYVDGTSKESVSWEETKEVALSLIAPLQCRLGFDGKYKGFHFSVRLIKVGEQRMGGFADKTNPYNRQTINGYELLNGSAGYTFKEKFTFYVTVQNALNQKYRNSLAMDLTDPNSPIFAGSLQDPARGTLGLRMAIF